MRSASMINYDDFDFVSYLVKVNDGSGVIFKPSSESEDVYIITASHNIEDDIDISSDCEDINLSFAEKNVIYSSEEHDLTVISLAGGGFQAVNELDLFQGAFTDALVTGYPVVKKDGNYEIEFFPCNSYKKTSHHNFEIRSRKSLNTDGLGDDSSVEGISGGGVFVIGGDKKPHLAGIVIESASFDQVSCLELSSILQNLEHLLKTPIQIYKYDFFNKLGISNPEAIDLAKISSGLITKNSDIKKINNLDDRFKKESLESIEDSIKNETVRTKASMKKLSEYYLYSGIYFHNSGDYSRSTQRFKRAITFDPRLKSIFDNAKSDRKKIQLSKTQKEFDASLITVEIEDQAREKLLFYKGALTDYPIDDNKNSTEHNETIKRCCSDAIHLIDELNENSLEYKRLKISCIKQIISVSLKESNTSEASEYNNKLYELMGSDSLDEADYLIFKSELTDSVKARDLLAKSLDMLISLSRLDGVFYSEIYRNLRSLVKKMPPIERDNVYSLEAVFAPVIDLCRDLEDGHENLGEVKLILHQSCKSIEIRNKEKSEAELKEHVDIVNQTNATLTKELQLAKQKLDHMQRRKLEGDKSSYNKFKLYLLQKLEGFTGALSKISPKTKN